MMARGGVWRQAVLGLVLGLWVGAVSGAPAAMQPSSSSDREVDCARPLPDVVWGFLLTLLALSFTFWSTFQHTFIDKRVKMFYLIVAVLFPFAHLMQVLNESCWFVVMVWYCHKMKYGRMSLRHFCTLLNPWSKSPIRILTSCNIVIYVKKRVSSSGASNERLESITKSWIWKGEDDVKDESEGMVIGEDGSRESKNMRYERKELSEEGKLALIWGEYFSFECNEYKFLPNYNELKFLRGNSGYAVLAIGIQAIGYIYGVIFRSVKDLRVAPIEVIGLLFNIVLLIGASLYSTTNFCARPLIIYMNKEREGKLMGILKSRPKSDFDINASLINKLCYRSMVIIVLFLCIPILIYFVISLKKTTNLMVVAPLIIFGLGLLMTIIYDFLHIKRKVGILEDPLQLGTLFILLLLNLVSCVWAVIVTFHYWKSQHFNIRPQLLDLSQIIPFIG